MNQNIFKASSVKYSVSVIVWIIVVDALMQTQHFHDEVILTKVNVIITAASYIKYSEKYHFLFQNVE